LRIKSPFWIFYLHD